jgi:hypothetical protein
MSLFIASLLLSERNAQYHSKYLQNMQVFTEMKNIFHPVPKNYGIANIAGV